MTDIEPEVPSFDRDPIDPDAPPVPVKFRVDGEEFDCAPVGLLPAGATRDLAHLAKADKNEQIILFGQFLDSVMLPESAERMAKRLRDPVNPVTDNQVARLVVYLINTYGRRPTTPVSSSANGDGTGGRN